MAALPEIAPGQRRFLVINYWIGSPEDGYLDGPILVSTLDYARFHMWDEPGAAELAEGEYQIVRLYPRGTTFEQAARLFAAEFPCAIGLTPPAQNFAAAVTFRAEAAPPTSWHYVSTA